MPSLNLVPTQASGSVWQNPANALSDDGLFARFPGGGSYPTGGPWLILKNMSGGAVPAGSSIVGLEVLFEARGDPSGSGGYGVSEEPDKHPSSDPLPPGPPPYYYRIEVALSIDGVNPVGRSWYAYYKYDWLTKIIGGPTYLFERVWSASEINSSNFAILFRRIDLTAELSVGPRDVDFARVTVHYNPPGDTFIMPREVVRQQILIGKETTPGTIVNTQVKLNAARIHPMPKTNVSELRAQGNKFLFQTVLNREHSEGPIDGFATYDELGYLLASQIAKPTVANPVAGHYVHTFRPENRKRDSIQTYTVEYGHVDDNAHRVAFALVNGLELDYKFDEEVKISGDILARQVITDSVVMGQGADPGNPGGADEVQNTGSGTGTGTFRFRYKGLETANLTEASLAADVQTALNALTNIGASGVTVTGTFGAGFVVTFGGTATRRQDHPLLEYRVISGTIAMTITQTTRGGYTEQLCVPISCRDTSIYVADTYAGLGAGKLTGVFLSTVKFMPRATPTFVLDRAVPSYKDYAEPDMGIEVKLTQEANAAGLGLLTQMRSGATKFLRIESVGPNIAGPGVPYKLVIDMAAKVKSGFDYGYDGTQEITTSDFVLESTNDIGWGNVAIVTLENGISAY